MEITGGQEPLKACSEQTGLTKRTNPTPNPLPGRRQLLGPEPTDAGLRSSHFFKNRQQHL